MSRLRTIHRLARKALASDMSNRTAALAVCMDALEQIAALCSRDKGAAACQDVQGGDREDGTFEDCARAHASTRESVAWLLQAEEQRQRACYLHLDRAGR